MSGTSIYRGEIEFSGVTAPGLRVNSGGAELVFWQEAQYVPCFDINGLWVTAEWFETLGNRSPYDYEPISDKANRYTFPEVIETGPARTVIRWRYALCDSTPEAAIFWGNSWAEEYYYLYPDGHAVRTLVGSPGDHHREQGEPLLWETGEIIVINPKGSVCHENIDPRPAIFSDLDGDEYTLKWRKERFGASGGGREETDAHLQEPLCIAHPSSCDWREYAISTNFPGRPRFFMVFPNNQELFPHAQCSAGCSSSDHSKIQIWRNYPAWKHWPVYDAEYHKSRTASEADMLATCTHTSIASIDPYMHHNLGSDRTDFATGPFWTPPSPSSWHFLVGTTRASHGFVRALGRSWLHPARIEAAGPAAGGAEDRYRGYLLEQRAYEFAPGEPELTFRIVSQHPIVNPVLLLREWPLPRVEVFLAGSRLREHEYEVSHTNGDLVVWIERTVEQPTEIRITPRA